jgi:hypothetical protein
VSDPFGDLHKNRSREDVLATAEARWEEAVVRHTLSQFSLGSDVRRKLAMRWKEERGIAALKFSVFNDTFPDFPFLLGTTRLGEKAVHKDPKATEPSRFKVFRCVPFVEAYRDFYQQNYHPHGLRKLGLVFPRRGFKYGMIIHNDNSETYWSSGLCWVYKSKHGDKLYVQPFSQLLKSIKDCRLWRPEI